MGGMAGAPTGGSPTGMLGGTTPVSQPAGNAAARGWGDATKIERTPGGAPIFYDSQGQVSQPAVSPAQQYQAAPMQLPQQQTMAQPADNQPTRSNPWENQPANQWANFASSIGAPPQIGRSEQPGRSGQTNYSAHAGGK